MHKTFKKLPEAPTKGLWRSRRQVLICRSTAEAELTSMCSLLDSLLGMSAVLESIHVRVPPILWGDNRAAIALTGDGTGATWRSRHFLLRAQALRQATKQGLVLVRWCSTSEMRADGLTKGLPREQLRLARDLWGLIQLPKMDTV